MTRVRSSFVDPNGHPLDMEIADIAISGVNAMEARPPFTGHLAFGLDPGTLGGIIRAADSGSTQPWMILAEEIEELYPHYMAVLSKRKRQLAQLPIKVEDADDSAEAQRHGDFVRRWLETDLVEGAIFDVADGIGKGWSTHEIMWDTEPGCVRPRELCWRHQKHFELSFEDGETLWLRTAEGFKNLPRHKFLVHPHASKSGQWHRSGLTRAVAFLWMYSAFTLKDWALFCQVYGKPVRVGRYGPEASRADKSVLWRAVSSIAGDVAAIIPKSMEMEFVKTSDPAAGAKLYLERADWLDRSVSKLVLGGTAGTDAIAGGHAVGKEHRSAEQDVERFDARLVGRSLTRRLAQPMVAFTFGPQKEYPRIVIGQEEKAPLKDVIAAVADLGPQGLRVKASELLERLDLNEPEAGDKVVGGVPPAPVQNPDIPHLAVTPPETQMLQPLRDLILAHSEVPEEIVERMSRRLADEAEGALAGLTDRVRAVFDAATDMHDLQHRLETLNLPKKEYAQAMARGMALANLVGAAGVMAEIGREAPQRHAALDAAKRAKLKADDFAVPGKRALPIHDAEHVQLAWDLLRRTGGLTPGEKATARRRILKRAEKLGVDTSEWDK